jgi:phosphatidylinositol 4-kinase A
VSRFSFQSVQNEVRWLLLNFTPKAINEPDALPILLGGDLPADVRDQLKVWFLAALSILDRF